MSTSSSRSRQLSVAVIIVGYFVVMLDATIVNVSLADIGRDTGASVNLLQWVVNAYTLVFAALLLGGGTACDRFGAKRVFLSGLAVFACGSMACALSGTMAQLIVSRALQGIGAAGIVPSSLALIPAVISERRQQTRIIGLWEGQAVRPQRSGLCSAEP